MGRKKEISDEDLLLIARECFLAHGASVATGLIAKQAGVSQATVFNRFESKKRLLILALAPQFSTKMEERLQLPLDERPISLQLVELGMFIFQMMSKNEPAIRVLRSSGFAWKDMLEILDRTPAPVLFMQHLIKWFERAKEKGYVNQATQPEIVAMVFAGTIKNLAMDDFFSSLTSDNQRTLKQITYIIDLLWRGLE